MCQGYPSEILTGFLNLAPTTTAACPLCGYDLRALGSAADPCPECGADAAKRAAHSRPRWVLLLALAPLIAFLSQSTLHLAFALVARVLDPGDPSRGISAMGAATSERYFSHRGLMWSFALPAGLAVVSAIAITRSRAASATVRAAVMVACVLAWVSVLAPIVADGTSDRDTTLIMHIGNIFLTRRHAWMMLAMLIPIAMFAPRRWLRAVAWLCIAISVVEVLLDCRHALHIPWHLVLSYDGVERALATVVWVSRAVWVVLAASVVQCLWRVPRDGNRPTMLPTSTALSWLRPAAALGWTLVVLLPIAWWAVRAPFAALGFTEQAWIVLVSRWAVTYFAAAAWVVPVFLLDDKRLRRAWIAAACAAVASALLFGGRYAPGDSVIPWTPSEPHYEEPLEEDDQTTALPLADNWRAVMV